MVQDRLILTLILSCDKDDALGFLERLSFEVDTIDALSGAATHVKIIAVDIHHSDKMWVRVLPENHLNH